MSVIPIRKPAAQTQPNGKSVKADQKSIDKLPLNSGTWRVDGIPGLYIRCRVESKSFFLQRRRAGRLAMETIGQVSMKAAKEKAMRSWTSLKVKPQGAVTLADAIERFISEKDLAPNTITNYRYNAKRYLTVWGKRTLPEIGNDRGGLRTLQTDLIKHHGVATANQVVRLISAVYRWQRKIDQELPEPPTIATPVRQLKARDWAYSPDELRAWWFCETTKEEKTLRKGVSTLGNVVKRAWWLSALFLGARKGSLESLRWSDIDFAKKIIAFRIAKGDRPYSVPLSDTLTTILEEYKKHKDRPPSEWVFPSVVIEDGHLKDVKNPNEGVGPAHRLRHTFRTTLAELGASPDQARLLMGHSMAGDVSRGYVTSSLLLDSLRPVTNAVAVRYVEVIGGVSLTQAEEA